MSHDMSWYAKQFKVVDKLSSMIGNIEPGTICYGDGGSEVEVGRDTADKTVQRQPSSAEFCLFSCGELNIHHQELPTSGQVIPVGWRLPYPEGRRVRHQTIGAGTDYSGSRSSSFSCLLAQVHLHARQMETLSSEQYLYKRVMSPITIVCSVLKGF